MMTGSCGETVMMATLTGDHCNGEYLGMLARSGVKGVRINSAHVTPDELKRMVEAVRLHAPGVGVLMDTKGPELRLNAPEGAFELAEGDEVEIARGKGQSDSRRLLLDTDVELTDFGTMEKVEIDDGRIVLSVDSAREDRVTARVERGGMIDSRKTLSMPEGVLMSLPAVSERDRLSIAAGLEAGIDMIAHSFVRSAADVEAVRRACGESGIEIFAKIECRRAVEKAEEICAAADGLLVARGDLGSQISLSMIPVVQLRLLQLCRRMGKRSMIATQIMESTLVRAVPTRSDLSDVALGVMEGADWLLLCNETAQTDTPWECIGWMRATIDDVTKNGMRCLIG